MITKQDLIRELQRCNREAFDCLANLEASGRLDPGALLGLKDWLTETRLLLEEQLETETHSPDPKLDSNSARTDLTDRECSKLLGGLIGALCQMAPQTTVRKAVRYWAETNGLWQLLATVPGMVGKSTETSR